jgi:hypothetical protein
VLFGPNAAQVPVTATFADVNRDGRLDILIHISQLTARGYSEVSCT